MNQPVRKGLTAIPDAATFASGCSVSIPPAALRLIVGRQEPKRGPSVARSRGFTLIEVMITVAIVAILAAIAYPSYSSYIRKGRRATAQAALMDLASKEQTYLLDRRAFSNVQADIGFAAPNEIQAFYTFSIACNPADCSSPGFIATATPSGGQAVSSEQPLTIDNTGAKTPAGTTGYWGQ